MQLFRGEASYQIDDRGRIPIPPRYRNEFATGAILVQGTEPCIDVFTESAWETEAEKLDQLSPESEEARNAFRDFYGNSHEVPRDTQGRIVIPPALREYASLEKEVMVVGVRDRLEIWNRETWDQRKETHLAARRSAFAAVAAEKDRARRLQSGGQE